MRATTEEIQTWIKSLLSKDICPECKTGKLYKFESKPLKNIAFWCETNGCNYGLRANGKYKGAALVISGGRPEMRGHEKDYGIQEDNI